MDVEDELAKAGRSWREGHRPPPGVDPRVFERSGPRPRPLTAVAAMVVVAIAIGLTVRWQGSGETGGPSASAAGASASAAAAPPSMRVVKQGDAVILSSITILEASNGLTACSQAVFAAVARPSGVVPPPPDCADGHSVSITGLAASTIPGWVVSEGRGYSAGLLDVEGRWTGSSVTVDQVEPAQIRNAPVADARFKLPEECAEAVAGWTLDRSRPAGGESAIVRLAEEVAAHPEIYLPPWRVYLGPIPSTDSGVRTVSGLVVGTVGDAASGQAHLGELYPANLCVIHVERSLHDLESVIDTIRRDAPDWSVRVDEVSDGLDVDLPVLDERAAAILAPYESFTTIESFVIRP